MLYGLEAWREEGNDTEHTKIAPETTARDDGWRIRPPGRVVVALKYVSES